jgi:hypothetical protein
MFQAMSREFVGSMMDLSSSMAMFGARQMRVVLGETASRQAMGAALQLLQQSAATVHAALPVEAGSDWRELANKLEAFGLFQQAPLWVGVVPGTDLPLQEQLRRASALGGYRSVWTAEGLGYANAESAWETGRAPGWLTGSPGLRSAFLPLHTGAALSFAGRLLSTEEARTRESLARWLTLWEDHTRAGYAGLAAEALGLVARNLYPHLVPRLAGILAALTPVLAEYFWHGVGRGLYFAPTHALPNSGSHGRALEKAWREPPDEAGRRNATAGLAWALTLVNLRHPEILAGVLQRNCIGSIEAFANGVASAVVVWHEIVGRDAHLEAFLAYRGPDLGGLWGDLVVGPCEEALQSFASGFRRGPGLADLFRFQPPLRKGVIRP